MLSLSQRDCLLGEKYGGKKVKDEDTRTFKVELSNVILDKTELAALLGEPHAYEALYDTSQKPHKPYLTCLKALELNSSWEGAYVALYYELGKSKIEFKRASLSKIRLELRQDGETAMSCTVEGETALNGKVVQVIERIGTSVEVEIRAQRPEDQRELPLNQHGEGEQAPRRLSRKGGGRRLNG
jgi:hypothetical protein